MLHSLNMTKKHPISLTKQDVIEAAITLADSGGFEQLSMRKLGSKLGVEAMAFYYHFANKNQLVEAMIDYVHAEIELPANKSNWKLAMRKRAKSAFNALSRHPWAASIMESSIAPGSATLKDSEYMLSCFREAGFSIKMSVHAVTVLNIYIYGAAQQYTKLSFSNTEQAAEVGQAVMQQFTADAYPYLAEMITEHMLKSSYNAVDEFNFGLDLVLDGLAKLAENNNE